MDNVKFVQSFWIHNHLENNKYILTTEQHVSTKRSPTPYSLEILLINLTKFLRSET